MVALTPKSKMTLDILLGSIIIVHRRVTGGMRLYEPMRYI